MQPVSAKWPIFKEISPRYIPSSLVIPKGLGEMRVAARRFNALIYITKLATLRAGKSPDFRVGMAGEFSGTSEPSSAGIERGDFMREIAEDDAARFFLSLGRD